MYRQTISPEVEQVIKPIIYQMTQIDIVQEQNPAVNPNNEPPEIRRLKRDCVHITYRNNKFAYRVSKDEASGCLVCAVCKQKIGTKFNEEPIEAYKRCLEAVNQLMFFGMLNGMRAELIAACITLKRMLPDAMTLHKQLNAFVSRENKSDDALNNLGSEYQTSDIYRNITGYTGSF